MSTLKLIDCDKDWPTVSVTAVEYEEEESRAYDVVMVPVRLDKVLFQSMPMICRGRGPGTLVISSISRDWISMSVEFPLQ